MRTIACLVALSLSALACGGPSGSVPPMPTPPPTEPPLPAAAVTPTASPTATPRPTATPTPIFGVQLDPAQPAQGQAFDVVVIGLQPGEPFVLTLFDLTAGHGRPMSSNADARGQFRLRLSSGVRDATCFTARRNDGSSTSGNTGPATVCADADAALSGPSPKAVGPSEFFRIHVNLPVGTQITFIGLTGPDGRRIPHVLGGFGWTRPVTEQPSGHIHRFSPEYGGAGALPAGDYTWSYEVLGRKYDFKVALVR